MSIPSSQVRRPGGAALAFDVFAFLFALAALVVLSAVWPDPHDTAGTAAAATTFGALATPAVLCAGFGAVVRRLGR